VPFKDILRELVADIPGAGGAILTDWEGEAVVYYCRCNDDGYELKVIGAHERIILDRAKEAHQRVNPGAVREVVITTDSQHFIIGAVGTDYSLILTLERDSMLGWACYRFKRSLKLLGKEIY
jgi:predicted regulator of Ras-like GTPase activity (Roadblock/LC7/MglB family)